MSLLKFILGALLFVGGALIVFGILLASPVSGVTATFAGLSFSFVPFLVIGIVGLIMILIGAYFMLTSRQ